MVLQQPAARTSDKSTSSRGLTGGHEVGMAVHVPSAQAVCHRSVQPKAARCVSSVGAAGGQPMRITAAGGYGTCRTSGRDSLGHIFRIAQISAPCTHRDCRCSQRQRSVGLCNVGQHSSGSSARATCCQEKPVVARPSSCDDVPCSRRYNAAASARAAGRLLRA